MQNFSAIRRAVRRAFQKTHGGLHPPLHWRGLKQGTSKFATEIEINAKIKADSFCTDVEECI